MHCGHSRLDRTVAHIQLLYVLYVVHYTQTWMLCDVHACWLQISAALGKLAAWGDSSLHHDFICLDRIKWREGWKIQQMVGKSAVVSMDISKVWINAYIHMCRFWFIFNGSDVHEQLWPVEGHTLQTSTTSTGKRPIHIFMSCFHLD